MTLTLEDAIRAVYSRYHELGAVVHKSLSLTDSKEEYWELGFEDADGAYSPRVYVPGGFYSEGAEKVNRILRGGATCTRYYEVYRRNDKIEVVRIS